MISLCGIRAHRVLAPVPFFMSVTHSQNPFFVVTLTVYSGRTKYSAFVSKLIKLSEKYLSLQKPQKAAFFFNRKIFGGRMI